MKKRALKTALIAIEVIAILMAIAAALVAFLYWRIGQGPVSLELFRPSVEYAIERRLPPGYDAVIDHIALQRAAARGDYDLLLTGVNVLDTEKAPAATAPRVEFIFSLGDFLGGRIGPKSMAVDQAKFRIVRRENLNVDIPIVKKEKEKKSAPALPSILDGKFLRSAFEFAELTNAEITFFDVASGRQWTAPGAAVDLRRTADGVTALVHGSIEMGDTRASIDAKGEYQRSRGVIDVVVDGENFPVGDLLSTFYGDSAAILEAPVSGRANIAFTPSGDVLSSRFNAILGAGALTVDGRRREVSHISWNTGFDPVTNRFSIESLDFDLEGAKGVVAGSVAIAFGEDVRKPERISFDLRSDEIVVDVPEQLPGPVPVSAIHMQGSYLIGERRLTFEDFAVELAGIAMSGEISLLRPRVEEGAAPQSPGLSAKLDIKGEIDPRGLMSVWPRSLASGAHDWVEERLEAAQIYNLAFTMDLPPGVVGEDGGLPDESLLLTFEARNATAHYVMGMTPLRNGSGRGVLRGNSFHLEMDRANVGNVAISHGEVDFPIFIPKYEPTYFRFDAAGDASEMLGIIDQPPLSLLSKVSLSPAQFSGTAKARVEIMRPNKRDVAEDEYGYKGAASFQDMTIKDLIGDIHISGAKGEVDLETRSMTVSADAQLSDDAPVKLLWRQNFFVEDGPSDIEISGVFDSTTGDLFGMSSRQFLRGPVKFDAKAVGEIGAFESLDVTADFTNALLTAPALGWRKPAGVPVNGDIEMTFGPGSVNVNKLVLEGEGVNVAGSLSLNNHGALQTADLERFYLADAADFAVNGSRDANGVLVLTAVGKFLNAGALIEQTLEGRSVQADDAEPFNWGPGLSFQARIDEIAMRGGVAYHDGALDMMRDASRLQALDFSAFGESGAPLRVNLALTGADDGPERLLDARTSEIGELISGVFNVRSVKGGEGSIRIGLHQGGKGGFSGELEARNLQIINAPLLARIFSAGSLDGLANLLSGEGIAFSYAYGVFDYGNGALHIDNMRATGSSVGITTEGEITLGPDGKTDLTGAVAPIYALNAVLGATPIIGDILVGKKGEGLFAFSYRVSGPPGDPNVFVNPLSALTPGIFRQLMQPSRVDRSAPEEASEPAPNAAPATDEENKEPAEEPSAQ